MEGYQEEQLEHLENNTWLNTIKNVFLQLKVIVAGIPGTLSGGIQSEEKLRENRESNTGINHGKNPSKGHL